MFAVSGFLLIGYSLAACHNEDKDSTFIDSKMELITALQTLQQSLIWQENQCEIVYQNIIDKAAKTQLQIDYLKNLLIKDKDLAQFIHMQLEPKLQSLKEESNILKDRCTALDYDAVGVSMERPSMLREMISEWQGTISLLKDQVNNPPNMNPKISLATLTNIQVNETTFAGYKFKDCSDDYCPELTVIPAGNFLMGGSLEEQERENVPAQPRVWELPQHSVSISKPFAMASFETTVGQFQKFQEETGWQVKGCRNWETREGQFDMWYRDDLNPMNPGFNQTSEEPVVCVRREDSREFAKWLSKKTGKLYRLPTEVEWEYAARADSSTSYYWGNDPQRNQACQYANVLDINTILALPNTKNWESFKCDDGYAFTAPVGQFLPNAFGLYDMSANAREWIDDCWHNDYRGAPNTNQRWESDGDGLCHFPVLRGGSWIYNTYNVRIAYRNAYFSSQARSNMWGFRLVREIE
ncbi:formylglycine-generating sulfatase enzyme [Acinetobacter equi]|uniref:Formylglycine-generating sulfatase enzyme n=2 Tax=Acinetobacter equi TaxID=1324350 RepID=A0A0N9W0A8_9GAMM|nr:formylglycine-generating sulfatase enzyme [Acinetobacter equi]